MILLVLGGARSGKSTYAERRAASVGEPVVYFATAAPRDDADFATRIAAHRARRPSSWSTVEAGSDLAARLLEAEGTALVDSLGTWLARYDDFQADVPALLDALARRAGDTVVVAEEVGLGVHPSSAAGRMFRDALGSANQAVAEVADEVVLVVAGRGLRLEPSP